MLQVQAATCTVNISSSPSCLKLRIMIQYAFIFEIWDTNGIKVWVALVCMFFDHHMQVATEVSTAWLN